MSMLKLESMIDILNEKITALEKCLFAQREQMRRIERSIRNVESFRQLNEQPKTKQLLNATDLAELIGVSPETIRRWTRMGFITGHQPGGRRYMYDIDEVREALVK